MLSHVARSAPITVMPDGSVAGVQTRPVAPIAVRPVVAVAIAVAEAVGHGRRVAGINRVAVAIIVIRRIVGRRVIAIVWSRQHAAEDCSGGDTEAYSTP